MAAKNSDATDEPLTETEQQAVDVIEAAGEGDEVLFNDRVQPLTVKRDNGSPAGLGKDNSLVLEGPCGGRYTLSHSTRYGNSVSLQRHTGYNDDGFRTYDDLTLESVELVNHHEFRIGQVLEVTDPLCEEYYEVVTGLPDSGCYDVETVGIRVRDGEIAGTKETGLFYSHDKERLFNGQLEVVDDLGFGHGSRTEYHDTEADEVVYLSDPHTRGVDCRPVDGTGLEVVDWDTILFGDRFEPATDEYDEPEIRTDGGRPTCTDPTCNDAAEYAYWMPDMGDFSRARAPEKPDLEDGDLCPYVCESCRDWRISNGRYDAERFVDPREQLVTDGGAERYCGTCGSDFDDWTVRDGRGPVFETIEYECPNGHRAKEHYDRRGYLSQSLGVKRRPWDTEGEQ